MYIYVIYLPFVIAEIQLLESILSDTEIKKANKYKFNADKERFVITRGALRFLLSSCFPQSPDEFVFHETAFGKPYLPNKKIYFNVSHSHQFSIIALSHQHPMGIDIENYKKNFDWQSIADEIFTNTEKKSILQFDESEQIKIFFDLWTCKEALCKADGRGLNFPFKDHPFTITQKRIYLPHQKIKVETLNINPAYSSAICFIHPYNTYSINHVRSLSDLRVPKP